MYNTFFKSQNLLALVSVKNKIFWTCRAAPKANNYLYSEHSGTFISPLLKCGH